MSLCADDILGGVVEAATGGESGESPDYSGLREMEDRQDELDGRLHDAVHRLAEALSVPVRMSPPPPVGLATPPSGVYLTSFDDFPQRPTPCSLTTLLDSVPPITPADEWKLHYISPPKPPSAHPPRKGFTVPRHTTPSPTPPVAAAPEASSDDHIVASPVMSTRGRSRPRGRNGSPDRPVMHTPTTLGAGPRRIDY